MAKPKPKKAPGVQLGVWITPEFLALIETEIAAVAAREGMEPSRSQMAFYLMRLGAKSKRRPPIV